jgi:hypothetical protein
MTHYSGKDFNVLHSKNEFYKLLNEDCVHHDFAYRDGLNRDTAAFAPNEQCKGGGLYFTEKNNVPVWMQNKRFLCRVFIPDDSHVFVETNKFKTDAFVLDLKNKIEVGAWSAWSDADYCEKAMQKSTASLQFVFQHNKQLSPSQTTQYNGFCETTLKYNGWMVKYIREDCLMYKNDKGDDISTMAVMQDGLAVEHIKEKYLTATLVKLAVKQNGMAIKHVPHKYWSAEVFMFAIKQTGFALQHVPPEYMTDALQEEAVKTDALALLLVPLRLQTFTMFANAVKQDGLLLALPCLRSHQTYELCVFAVRQNSMALQHVLPEFMTYELSIMSVKKNGLALQHVLPEFMRYELCLMAVKQNGMAVQYVPPVFATHELLLEAMRRSGWALQHVPQEQRTPEVEEAALNNEGLALKFIEDKIPELCGMAITQNLNATYFVPSTY